MVHEDVTNCVKSFENGVFSWSSRFGVEEIERHGSQVGFLLGCHLGVVHKRLTKESEEGEGKNIMYTLRVPGLFQRQNGYRDGHRSPRTGSGKGGPFTQLTNVSRFVKYP